MGKCKIAIIGGGISGLMAAYSLCQNKDISVTIFEKGAPLETRSCPLLHGKTSRCVKCASCAIMEGVAGAGAFSDGKYNITTEFGGWLQDIIDKNMLLKYIEKVDSTLVNFGATTDRFMPNNELKKMCLQHDLYMLQSQCKHLGTDANYDTMLNLITYLKNQENVSINTQTEIVDVSPAWQSVHKTMFIVGRKYGDVFTAKFDKVIFAVGRSGNQFFSKWCLDNHVEQKNNQVDIGVRVELPALIWDDFEKKIYEPKIIYKTKQYGDTTRMFCFNGRGEVVTENTNGVLTVNGHAYKAESKKTNNTNFALLSSTNFTSPFHEPVEYARDVAALANKISGGSVILQTLGDLENGRRTNEHRLSQSRTIPTLKSAVAGDLSLCMPKRQLDNIIETLHVLDNIAPGTANHDTLLYGVEAKYYSARPEVNENFEIIMQNEEHSNIFAIGDGAGFTRSLSQAGAMGLYVADCILN